MRGQGYRVGGWGGAFGGWWGQQPLPARREFIYPQQRCLSIRVFVNENLSCVSFNSPIKPASRRLGPPLINLFSDGVSGSLWKHNNSTPKDLFSLPWTIINPPALFPKCFPRCKTLLSSIHKQVFAKESREHV